ELGYDETILKYNALAMVASLQDDELTPYLYAEKLLAYSEAHPEYIRSRPYNHMIRYQNLINRCIRMRKYEHLPEILVNLKAFPDRYKVKTKDTIQRMIFIRAHALEFAYLFECGLKPQLHENVALLKEGLANPIYRVEPIWKLAIAFSLGCYYLAYQRQPEICLDWMDEALFDEGSRLDRRYLLCARILFLFSHLALDNLLFLTPRLSETTQYMNKHQIHSIFTDQLIQLLKRLTKPLHVSEKTILWEETLTIYLDNRGKFELFSGYRTLMQAILMYFHESATRPHIHIPEST
ncbi:MAG: hypothetical protein AAF598_11730, partial [Bacteroidota bacterium]